MENLNLGPIVVIDDDTDDLELATYAIRFLKYNNDIITYKSGKELIDGLLAEQRDPFVIICDVNLPKWNGMEVRKMLLDDQRLQGKSIPFIFWSTSPSLLQIKEVYENWSQGIFEKPAALGELVDLLDTILTYWTKCGYPRFRTAGL